MNKLIIISAIVALLAGCASLNSARLTGASVKVLQAATLSDAQIEVHAKAFIASSDKRNKVCAANNPYTIRLNRIVGNFNGKGGLNIKVYNIKDVNAFACADGSIRIYSGLMDVMSDAEILGVVGHEIGHIRNKDTKNAFRQALLNSALKDGIASTSGVAAVLTDSELGAIGEVFLGARYSQKQEFEADNYGYNFLKANGANPWAMAMSFQKLRQIEIQSGASKSSAMQQLFSTHPDIEVRMAKMAERASKEGFVKPKK